MAYDDVVARLRRFRLIRSPQLLRPLRPHWHRGLLSLAAVVTLVGSLAFSLAGAPTAHAASFTVSVCSANSPTTVGSLDYELALAQASSGATVTFSCSGDIVLDQTLFITTTVTLDGSGQVAILDGANAVEGVQVQNGANLTLKSLAITGGSSGIAGGIENDGGALTLSRSLIENSVGRTGGAIFSTGTLTVTDSVLANNTATFEGGGIAIGGGTLTLTNSTVLNNSAQERGGGIYNENGAVTLTNSAVKNNQSTVGAPQDGRDGGGIFNTGGTLTLMNSTVSGNTAPTGPTSASSFGGEGGGIENFFGALVLTNSTVDHNVAAAGGGIGNANTTDTATITNSTVAGNTASIFAGGIYNEDGTMILTNSTVAENAQLSTADGPVGGIMVRGPVIISGSIVADNTAGNAASDCGFDEQGAFTDKGSNLESGSDCGFTGTGSLQNTDPQLASALASNGGQTQTLALGAGSPAIDAVPAASGLCPATDQRGSPRPDWSGESTCDIGAYEFQDDADLALTNLPSNITVNATSPQGATVSYTAPTVVDEDSSLPTVSCAPASGGVFPIGATTVTCTVSDNDDVNSPVSSSFIVTVQGAAPMTSGLITTVNSLHLKMALQNSLDAELTQILGEIEQGQTALACGNLADFITHARGQTGKGLTASQAAQLIAAAKNIQAVLGC